MKGGALSPPQRERLLGYLDRKPRLGPETVHIDLVNACNLDCVTCWNYAPGLASPKTPAWKAQRMDEDTFYRVLAEVASTDVERIILSGGGEPFLHPRIHEFISAVKARGLALTVISNGTLCDFPRLAALGVDQMLLNTSAASAATYVAYHPNQDESSFDRLVDGIAEVRGRIGINLVQVINALNAHELGAMVELSARVGARASFKLGDTPPGTEALALTGTQRQTLLLKSIPAARAAAEKLDVKHNLDSFATQLVCTTSKKMDAPPPCFAGYLYSRVFVDGRVFFCCEHIEVGRIDFHDFATIWSSPDYDAVRHRLHEGRGYPGCTRCGKHDMNFTAVRQLARLQAET
jgi:MoaA/NifB/PqqE/SkfB family radical SAM enzyme